MSILSVLDPDSTADGLVEAAPSALRYHAGIREIVGDELHEVEGLVRDWLPSGVRVLDVGCGTGSTTLSANRGKGNLVVGLEPDAERAALARANGLETVHGVLDEAFLSERGPFDVIMFTDVLEHLAAPAQLLKLARDGLSERGIILASVPNVAHWTVRLKLLLGRFDYDQFGIMDATHLRWFTRKTFVALFERQGLEVVDLRAAPGTWHGVYRKLPFSLLPSRPRYAALRVLTRAFPQLFACQFVIMARQAA